MATKAKERDIAIPDNVQWDTIDTAVPETWDFEQNPILIGRYVGSELAKMIDPQDPESRRLVERTAYRIMAEDGLFTVWESLHIRRALSQVIPPRLVRITYNGKEGRADGKTEKIFVVEVARN